MRFNINLEVSYDQETNNLIVENTKITPILDYGTEIITETGKITQSSFSYGLITFPANSHLNLSEGEKIKVKYKDYIVPVTISSVRGRISGLTRIIGTESFLKEFDIGDEIKIIYDKNSRLMELRK